nr:transposase [uncultured Caproiciproducens sp.]
MHWQAKATGIYHLPVLSYLKEQNIFVAVINPYVMKKYASTAIRKGKTDKLGAIRIANYGLDNWFHLVDYTVFGETDAELRLLGRQYAHYINLRVQSMHTLTNMLDYTMPGIKNVVRNDSSSLKRKKLCDFAEQYWHFDNISAMSEAGYAAFQYPITPNAGIGSCQSSW